MEVTQLLSGIHPPPCGNCGSSAQCRFSQLLFSSPLLPFLAFGLEKSDCILEILLQLRVSSSNTSDAGLPKWRCWRTTIQSKHCREFVFRQSLKPFDLPKSTFTITLTSIHKLIIADLSRLGCVTPIMDPRRRSNTPRSGQSSQCSIAFWDFLFQLRTA
jgi:hypothetical protein